MRSIIGPIFRSESDRSIDTVHELPELMSCLAIIRSGFVQRGLANLEQIALKRAIDAIGRS